ncbi:DUF4857 domain-containing protein [Oleidesulfovibrio sp.]|uniref:DUF4857 domain-containing protein n=1 Tax=Oleidesulfovibrio sp. TaxID=2909707 RepID=UPI003A87E81B
MNAQIKALLGKEWIKLRRGIWLIPLLLGVAAIDALLTLNTIERVHGAFGLWTTLVAKEPMFFKFYVLIALCAIIIGLLQAWPETQNKRIRLLFHMPTEPERIVGVMIATGLALVGLTSLIAHGLLVATMMHFNLPADIIIPVLLTVAQWSVLSVALYLGIISISAPVRFPVSLMGLAAFLIALELMLKTPGYARMAPSLWRYALFAAGFVPLVFFSYLPLMGEPGKHRLYSVCRAASLLLVTVALCAVLPDLYWRICMPDRVGERLYYSPVEKQFVISSSYTQRVPGPQGSAGPVITLEDGTVLDLKQRALALPVLHAEDLIKWKMFPDTIAGKVVTLHQAKYGWQFMRFKPRDWNVSAPMLHMMLESRPHGAKLEMPDDLFRLGSGESSIEFIDPETGAVRTKKSEQFTTAMMDAGFEFPVQAFGGNPDTRKEYDEGYLFVDARGGVFKLQMVEGRPVCINSGQRIEEPVRGVFVSESRRREMVGYIVSDSGVYSVMQSDLSLRQWPLNEFDADSSHFYLWADPLCKVIVSGNFAQPELGLSGVAMDPDFTVKRTYDRPMHDADVNALDLRKTIASALFPVRIVQHSPITSYVTMDFEYAAKPLVALASGVVCTLLMVFGFRAAGRRVRLWDCVLVAAFGPVALLVATVATFREISFRNLLRR